MPCPTSHASEGSQAQQSIFPKSSRRKLPPPVTMSGAGQSSAPAGPGAQAARSSNLQLDATVRALEHSHLTSRPLSLHDFVLTAAPSSLGKDVKLLHAKCTRAGLPQSDKTYLLKVCQRCAERLTPSRITVAVCRFSHAQHTTHMKMSWRLRQAFLLIHMCLIRGLRSKPVHLTSVSASFPKCSHETR